jgi:hypothetical protein
LCGEEEVLEGCGRVVEVLVVRASDIAKLLANPPEGDEVSLRFGKVFEEEYTLANHIYSETGYAHVPRWFARKVAARLRAEGIYSRELVLKAYRAYAALLRAGVVGEKPRTRFREVTESLYVAAQPDLYDSSTDTYYEFKLYPINDYARKQAEVFAWVLGRPVVLVGLREGPGGYLTVEREVVQPPRELGVDVGRLREVAEVQEFCSDLKVPLHQFERDLERSSRYYLRYLEYMDLEE